MISAVQMKFCLRLSHLSPPSNKQILKSLKFVGSFKTAALAIAMYILIMTISKIILRCFSDGYQTKLNH